MLKAVRRSHQIQINPTLIINQKIQFLKLKIIKNYDHRKSSPFDTVIIFLMPEDCPFNLSIFQFAAVQASFVTIPPSRFLKLTKHFKIKIILRMSSLAEEICLEVPPQNITWKMKPFLMFFEEALVAYGKKQPSNARISRIQKSLNSLNTLDQVYNLLHRHPDYWEIMVRLSYDQNSFENKFYNKWANTKERKFKLYVRVFVAFVRSYWLIKKEKDLKSYCIKLQKQAEDNPLGLFPPQEIENKEHLEIVIEQLKKQRLENQKTEGFSTKHIFPTIFKTLSFGIQVFELVFPCKRDVSKTIKQLLKQNQNKKTSETFKEILTVSKEFEAFMICLTHLSDFKTVIEKTFQGSKDSEDLKAALQNFAICVQMIRRSDLIKPGKKSLEEAKNKIQKEKQEGKDPQYQYVLFENTAGIAITRKPILNGHKRKLWRKAIIQFHVNKVLKSRTQRKNIQDEPHSIKKEKKSELNTVNMDVEIPVPVNQYPQDYFGPENLFDKLANDKVSTAFKTDRTQNDNIGTYSPNRISLDSGSQSSYDIPKCIWQVKQ